MPTPGLLYVTDGTVQMTLASNYTAGSGSFTLSSAPSFPAGLSPGTATPFAWSLISKSTYAQGAAEVSTTYYITGISGNTLTIGGILAGTDRNYNAGDYAESRVDAAAVNAAQLILAYASSSAGQVLTSNGASSAPSFQAPSSLAPTGVKVGAYTASAGQFIPCDVSGGAFTVTLPTAPPNGTQVGVKLINVGSGTNALTVAAGGSDVFNKAGGSASLSLKWTNQTVSLQYYAPAAIWYVIAGDNSLGQIAAGTNQTLTTSSGSLALSVGPTNVETDQHWGAITTDADGATVTFNLGLTDWHQVVLGGNRTLALSGGNVGQQFSVILQQDGTGSRTVTWWSGILWPGGTAPTLTTTANKRDIFTFKTISAGVFLGFVAGQSL